MRDVEKMALSMPETSKELRDDDRPAYLVDRKPFCFHRTPRRDALDSATGDRLDDVVVFYVADEEMKMMWLADRPSVFFTTEHFNGYPAILTRISSLAQIDREELAEIVSDAWLARAPKKLAQRWLRELGLDVESE